MVFQHFWINVGTAARFTPQQRIVDAPRLDPSESERILQQDTHWFTPRSVAGFEEADFDFLPDAERTRPAKLVNEFQAISSTVSPKTPPSAETVAKALPLFRDMVQLLGFDRYGDVEAYRLGKQIEPAIEPDRPAELAELRFNTGLDHSGDPALWIWAFLTDEAAATDERFLRTAQDLSDFLDPVARTVAPDRWPYISFRALADQAEPVEAT